MGRRQFRGFPPKPPILLFSREDDCLPITPAYENPLSPISRGGVDTRRGQKGSRRRGRRRSKGLPSFLGAAKWRRRRLGTSTPRRRPREPELGKKLPPGEQCIALICPNSVRLEGAYRWFGTTLTSESVKRCTGRNIPSEPSTYSN